MRKGQTELDLVGGHISVSTALDRTEGVESRAGGASDTEGVHYGGTVGGRGVWGAVAMGVSSCCRRKAANCRRCERGPCLARRRCGLNRRWNHVRDGINLDTSDRIGNIYYTIEVKIPQASIVAIHAPTLLATVVSIGDGLVLTH